MTSIVDKQRYGSQLIIGNAAPNFRSRSMIAKQ